MTSIDYSLASLIEKGGVYYNVPGLSRKELIAGIIDLLPPVSGSDPHELLFTKPAGLAVDSGFDPKKLLVEILEREALVSTAISRGIALPHPRGPIAGEPFIALAFPDNKIDWNAPDSKKVHTVFLIVSMSIKQHLNTLSKINFLCQKEEFYSLLVNRSKKEIIISAIREAETVWRQAPDRG